MLWVACLQIRRKKRYYLQTSSCKLTNLYPSVKEYSTIIQEILNWHLEYVFPTAKITNKHKRKVIQCPSGSLEQKKTSTTSLSNMRFLAIGTNPTTQESMPASSEPISTTPWVTLLNSKTKRMANIMWYSHTKTKTWQLLTSLTCSAMQHNKLSKLCL